MGKISLKNVDVKKFTSLIKRSSALDNLIFITIDGSGFESVAYNKTKSALKAVMSDLERVCGSYSNDYDHPIKVQFSNASKLISVLSLVGTDNVNIVIDIEDDYYAKKILVFNDEVSLTVPCADKAAVNFLEIPADKRQIVFEGKEQLQFSLNISDSEFKYINALFNLNKDSVRVLFNKDGEDVYMSEIEATDENVRTEVNRIIDDRDYAAFNGYEKLYNKKLNITDLDNVSGEDSYIACFNKQYFVWIDSDKYYNVEFHKNKVKFTSFDDDASVKTSVILTPVKFA